MSIPTRGRPGFTTTVITPWGRETYQVLLREEAHLWAAMIITLPNRVWAKSGGREALKFHGATAAEAEKAAVEFIEAERIATGRRLWSPWSETAAKNRPTAIAPPQGQDHPAARYPLRLLVRFGSDAPKLPGLTANVSESGLFVITDSPNPVGRHVQIDLRFPDQPVLLSGEVVWVSPRKVAGRNVGFGARLIQKPFEYTARIRELQIPSP